MMKNPDIKVTPVECVGDVAVVNAARCSFDKQIDHMRDKDKGLISFLYRNNHWSPFGHPQIYLRFDDATWTEDLFAAPAQGCEVFTNGSSAVLVRASLWYILENYEKIRHTVSNEGLRRLNDFLSAYYPVSFSMVNFGDSIKIPDYGSYIVVYSYAIKSLIDEFGPEIISYTFIVEAPIFVRTQCFKSKIQLIENEVSRRYVKDDPEFYFPAMWRKASSDIKQGSLQDEFVEDMDIPYEYEELLEQSIHLYNKMIDRGIAAEQARMILPQSMITKWWWTGGYNAFKRFCDLRLKSDAQYETRYVATQVNEYIN